MASSAEPPAARAAPAFAIVPMSAATRRALDVCCQHDRDAVLDEQKRKIAAQAREIQALRRGIGVRMGPVWAEIFKARGQEPDEDFTESQESLHDFLRTAQLRASTALEAANSHLLLFPDVFD